MPSSNPLPPKENALFKRILKSYEQKQYKNGLKFAKQILSHPKYAEHGETLAMKGLILNYMGKKEEAYDHVRRGLRNDLRSHICWHVFGLLQRSDRLYDEAIKAYRNALKWDKENIQILLDLSLLQVQIRDLEGYKDTRYQLLKLRPTQKGSWIGYAMAFHLLEDYTNAFKISEQYRKTQETNTRPFNYEYSELLLYQNMILRESGKLEEALTHLLKYEKQIVDKQGFLEIQADLCLKLGRQEEAHALYHCLIRRNPENQAYYRGLEKAKQPESIEARCQIYSDALEEFPRARVPTCIPLSFVTGDAFRQRVDVYLRKNLHKGVPNLFKSLKHLYRDDEKVESIQSILLGYVECLKSCSKFAESDEEEQCPTALLWCYYFLAQHYDALQQHESALEFIEKCLEHTPTLIEAYVIKGRIFKHAGNFLEAARCLDEAQSLDTADRYINTVCARYMLRANLIKEAEGMCAKFTREGVPSVESLNEMQCMWFQTECAKAYRRLANWGEALKCCHQVDRHFTDIVEDQFDFHTYCIRKMTLSSYMGLLRMEDDLRSHPFFIKAATDAIEIYLYLHDNPLTENDEFANLNSENLSASELKKLKNKMRKQQRKAQQEKERQQQEKERREQNRPKEKEADNDKPKEQQLDSAKLARPENALEEAVKFLRALQVHARQRIETHCTAFEVYYKKNKLMLMLQSIKRGWKIDPEHPHLHSCIVRFLKLAKEQQELAPPLSCVLQQEVMRMFGDQTAEQVNHAYLEKHADSVKHRLAASRMLCWLDNSKQEEACSLITSISREQKGFSIETCSLVYESLRAGELGECGTAAAESFKTFCHAQFPHTVLFWPRERQEACSAAALSHNHLALNDKGITASGDEAEVSDKCLPNGQGEE